MPKNKGKGGKNRKRGKNENLEDSKRELIIKDHDQDYAQVIRMLGGGYVEALCLNDGKKRVCHIRGKLHKKIWINVADIILVSIREYEPDKADVLLKYTPDEARQLQKAKAIPRDINLAEATSSGQSNDVDNVYFGNSDNGSDEDDDGEEEEEGEENINEKRDYDLNFSSDNDSDEEKEDDHIDRI